MGETLQISRDFWRDGAVCVRQAFSRELVELASEAIDTNLATLSPRAKRASAAGDGAFVENFCNSQHIEPMRRFAFESPAAEVAGQLMGAATVRLYYDHILVKEPGTAQRTPWHQDLPYYNVDGRRSRRRVLSVRFLGDDMVHAPRRWKTSPAFPGLVDELPAGAALDHPLFPVVWKAAR